MQVHSESNLSFRALFGSSSKLENRRRRGTIRDQHQLKNLQLLYGRITTLIFGLNLINWLIVTFNHHFPLHFNFKDTLPGRDFEGKFFCWKIILKRNEYCVSILFDPYRVPYRDGIDVGTHYIPLRFSDINHFLLRFHGKGKRTLVLLNYEYYNINSKSQSFLWTKL